MTQPTARWVAPLVLATAVIGCGRKDRPAEAPHTAPVQSAARASGRSAAPRETWDSIYFQGVKVGYVHQKVEPVEQDGRPLVRIFSKTSMKLRRGLDTTVLDLETVSFDTPDGRLVRFESTENQAGNRTVVGQADQSGIDLEIRTRDKVEKQHIDWGGEPPQGFWVENQSLRDKPLEPGQTRTLRKFEPYLYRLADVTLKAKNYEDVELPTGTARLLRLEYTNSLMPDKSLIWMDADGEVLKTQSPFEQSVVRTTKALALAEADKQLPDLASASTLPVDNPLSRPHETIEARYSITVEGSDPAQLFPSGSTQQVRSRGNNTIELVVRAVDPVSVGREPAPADEFRQPNAILQSDAPRIRALTEAAVGDATDPVEVALRLEKWVHDNLSQKNMKFAFVTAADVAENLEGDCTEHAVLLAAMARAAGIPSRVVVGLIAINDGRAFGFHAWTEVFAAGKWLPLDATLGRGRIGAGHIKLGDSSLQGADALSLLLPVARVLNRMHIEVVDYRYE